MKSSILDVKSSVINPGDPDHKPHKMDIKRDSGHDIGTCSCGREIDYTILQRQLPEMRDGYIDRCFNMTQVTKTRQGNLKSLKEKPKKHRIA